MKTDIVSKRKNHKYSRENIKKDISRNRELYLIMIPVVVFYFIFSYMPMYGVLIAFQDYTPAKGFLGSEFVGLKHFINFVTGNSFFKLLGNTLRISCANIIFGFPAPIILALLINEIRNKRFKSVIQSCTYLPHFISIVVVAGMIKDFTISTGLINDIVAFFGGERVTMLAETGYFIPIYVISGIWQEVGWSTIIYLAALTGIDQQLYEAATIDGAGEMKKMWHITLPGILPTIVILLVMKIGSMLNVGYEKIILLYNPSTYDVADVISTYVYRKGIQERSWSFSTAVGLFNSVINVTLLVISNRISKKINGIGLW